MSIKIYKIEFSDFEEVKYMNLNTFMVSTNDSDDIN